MLRPTAAESDDLEGEGEERGGRERVQGKRGERGKGKREEVGKVGGESMNL